MKHNQIFALDIGTRKVVGLVMERDEQGYQIVGAKHIEHTTRAMLDGQIHDVEVVASVITRIKNSLEEELDIKLDKAAVAAAGRALKTARGKAETNRGILSEITREEALALELEAVQNAQYVLAKEEIGANDKSNYFCAGYSVAKYQLEGQDIASLVGQVTKTAAVEVIATFLPRVVVDSLFSALKKADLEVFSLTLEPIAALSLAIPQTMRLLNLVLVDIGAGTSDIAIVKNGNIYAYAMVPMGGDEITEAISAQYLLDFNYAEKLKLLISIQDRVEFTDILGNKTEMDTSEMKEGIQPVIAEIAGAIAGNIMELNQKVPDAVLCVGGGSLAPSLVANIADALGIARNRAGIKSRSNFEEIKGDFAFLDGPQGVTPLGIAFNSFDKPPVPLIKVTVNERETALWNMGNTDVMRALLSSGISLNNIYGKPGMGKTIEINGYVKVIKGDMGVNPLIKVNGQDSGLDTPVHDGDLIIFEKGSNGKDASITLRDINSGTGGYVYVNGEKLELLPVVTVNDHEFDIDREIPDRAKVKFCRINQLNNILTAAGVAEHLLVENVFHYSLNDQELMLKWSPVVVTVDGVAGRLDQTVSFGSYIEYTIRQERPGIKDLIPEQGLTEINVIVNETPVTLSGSNYSITVNGRSASIEEPIYNGVKINLKRKEAACMLSDIFKVININPAAARSRLIMEVNGEPAGFTTPIYENSKIKLGWGD